MINEIDTATERWLIEKFGCFSASEMYKLLSKGTSEMFGVAAKTYIQDVAIEAYTTFNTEGNVETYAMKMGKINEANSYGHYKNVMQIHNIEYHGGSNPVFKKYCEDSGCSPDALVLRNDGSISFGVEFKNNQSKQHFTDLRLIADKTDLKKEHLDDYTQCQFSMMCYGLELWHWVIYNEYFPNKDKMMIIEVTTDKAFQDNLFIRLQMAKKIKHRIIEQRKNDYKGDIDFKS